MAWLVLASFSPDPAPSPAAIGPEPTPFLIGMLAGFVVGALGHLFRSRVMVALGVAAVFISTFLLPLVLYLSRS
jgi:hypothetical protein